MNNARSTSGNDKVVLDCSTVKDLCRWLWAGAPGDKRADIMLESEGAFPTSPLTA